MATSFHPVRWRRDTSVTGAAFLARLGGERRESGRLLRAPGHVGPGGAPDIEVSGDTFERLRELGYLE
jgi:hypothetical protein